MIRYVVIDEVIFYQESQWHADEEMRAPGGSTMQSRVLGGFQESGITPTFTMCIKWRGKIAVTHLANPPILFISYTQAP